jgi:hypothetical protein
MFIVRWLDKVGRPTWRPAPNRITAEREAARVGGQWLYVEV